MTGLPIQAHQRLPRDAYFAADWLALEQDHLFSKSWMLEGLTSDVPDTGDYRTLTAGRFPLVVLRDAAGRLRAFHNVCRHRGTELVEGAGNAGSALVCPYHRWTYGLDGNLRGVSNESECFPGLDKSALGLHEASVGVFRELVFVHPDPAPDEEFSSWVAGLDAVAWPHDLTSPALGASTDFVYDMKCNWKVFFENAIDGYHLGYLHEKTLGGPPPGQNVWEPYGRHLVWYSTENGGKGSSLPKTIEDTIDGHNLATIKDAENNDYGGVYMMFPSTIIVASPYSISVSQLIPTGPEITRLTVCNWSPNDSWRGRPEDAPGFDPATGICRSDNWTEHPLDTGDFHTEEVWICEKIQRNLHSPVFEVGALASGAGAESPLTFFQTAVLDMLDGALATVPSGPD